MAACVSDDGFSLYWFGNLFEEQMVGDFKGFSRSFSLVITVML